MAEYVERIVYEADISDAQSKIKRLQGQVSGMAGKHSDDVDKMSKRWTDFKGSLEKATKATQIAVAAVGAFAAVKVVGFLNDSVKASSDLNESISKAGVVFKESGKIVLDFARDSATAMGQSQQQAVEAAATYGNLFVSMGIGTKESAKMSTSLVKLASDLASFNNASPEEALEALRSGLVGETEPLRRFGVNLNEATLKAKAISAGLVEAAVDTMKVQERQVTAEAAQRRYTAAVEKHGAGSAEAALAAKKLEIAEAKVGAALEGKVGDLTAAQKAQAAYLLITEQTTTAQGDFERTSGGLANQQRILAAQFVDLKAKVGGALLPIVLKMVSGIKRLGAAFGALFTPGEGAAGFAAAMDKLLGGGGKYRGFFEGLGRGILTVVGTVRDMTGAVVRFFSHNPDALMAALAGTITAVVVPAVFALGAALWSLASNPVVLIVAAVAGLVAGLVYLWTHFERWRKVILAVGAVIGFVVAGPITLIVAAIAGVVAAVRYAWQHHEGFRDVVRNVWEAIQQAAQWAWQNVLEPVFTAVAWVITDIVIPAVKAWWDVTVQAFQMVAKIVQWAWSNVLSPIWTLIWGTVKNILIPIQQELMDVWKTVWDAVVYAVRWAWSIIEPIWNGIVSWANTYLIPIWQIISTSAKNAWSDLVTATGMAWGQMVEAIKGPLRVIGDLLAGFLNQTAKVADAIGLDHLAGGIREAAAAVGKWGEEAGAKSFTGSFHGGLARGGRVGAGFETDGPMAIVGEGRRAYPEYVIPTDPQYRDRALGLYQKLGGQLLEGGGILDWVGGVASGAVDWVADLAGEGAAKTVEMFWPQLDVPNGLAGVPAGGVNKTRQWVIDWLRDVAEKEKAKRFTFAGGTWEAIPAFLDSRNIPYRVVSTVRPGARTRATGAVSLHSLGRAADLTGPGGGGDVDGGMRIHGALLSGHNARQILLDELLYSHADTQISRGGKVYGGGIRNAITRADHWDHVHAAVQEAMAAMAGSPVLSGDESGVKGIVQKVAAEYGWGSGAQWAALDWLVQHESSWNPNAQNPTSTAYGLFQFLNGTWAGTGVGKTSDPYGQAVAGLKYIAGRYGDPLGAKSFWESHRWYGDGGLARTPQTAVLAEKGPEVVIPQETFDRIAEGANRGDTYVFNGVAGSQDVVAHLRAERFRQRVGAGI